MPKQNQSETLSLPQLLQLAGIGQQPQQDSTREALSYMMGQQRLAADDADRKVRQLQAEQENAYRMKALEQQMGQHDQSAANAELALAAQLLYQNPPGSEGHAYGQSILTSRLGPRPELPKTAEQIKADEQAKSLADLEAKKKAYEASPESGGAGLKLRNTIVTASPTGPQDLFNTALTHLGANVREIFTGEAADRRPTLEVVKENLVNDAQLAYSKHQWEKAKRHAAAARGLPIPYMIDNNNPQPEPVAWYDLPTQVLNIERAQAISGAQAQTQEYLKRKAALRQAAGINQ